MKKLALIFVVALCAFATGRAQNSDKLTAEERAEWLKEMRNYKHEFLARELQLTKEQQEQFFPVYDAMDDALNQISLETRELVSKVSADPNASDLELETTARALFEQKKREGEVEVLYFEKLKDTITPIQLLRLKNAERKFTQQLVKHHGRSKAETQRRKQ